MIKKLKSIKLFFLMLLAACSPKSNLPDSLQKTTPKEQHIALSGSYNTRDLGGYVGAGGKIVRLGLIYRSDDFAKLSPADLSKLAERNLKTIIDFRSNKEEQAAPNRLPKSVTLQQHLPIDAASMIDISTAKTANGAQLMITINRTIINHSQAQYRDFFRLISTQDNLPALFHCSAGKDRTGIAAALLLSALGVDRETIYADYLLSDKYLAGKYDYMLRDNPALAPLLTVKREYLAAAFEEIDKKYGGVNKYLSHNLGVDIEKLKNIYLQ